MEWLVTSHKKLVVDLRWEDPWVLNPFPNWYTIFQGRERVYLLLLTL